MQSTHHKGKHPQSSQHPTKREKGRNLKMNIFNKVAKTMNPAKVDGDPTVHFFGWDGERGALTDELGQPEGNTISEMSLDSMTHAIIMTGGERPYRIHSVLPAGLAEFILILRIPGAVFVARYLSTALFETDRSVIREELGKIPGRMNVKIEEMVKNDGPHEYSVPEVTCLDVYYPQAPTGRDSTLKFQAFVDWLGREFKNNSTLNFSYHTYSGNQTEVVVTVPTQTRGLASITTQ